MTLGALFLLARLRGVTELGPLGVFALFRPPFWRSAGVSIFCLGASFNYLVALFYQRPIRQGLFGKPLFRRRWSVTSGGWAARSRWAPAGCSASAASSWGCSGWPQARLWFWELLSAGTILVGLQLIVSWSIMRALAELSQRELRVAGDLRGSEAAAIPPAPENKVMAEWLNELN